MLPPITSYYGPPIPDVNPEGRPDSHELNTNETASTGNLTFPSHSNLTSHENWGKLNAASQQIESDRVAVEEAVHRRAISFYHQLAQAEGTGLQFMVGYVSQQAVNEQAKTSVYSDLTAEGIEIRKEATHTCSIPCLYAFPPGVSCEDRKRGFIFLKGSDVSGFWNATVAMDKRINQGTDRQFDEHINPLRKVGIRLLNAVSMRQITPEQGLILFLEEFLKNAEQPLPSVYTPEAHALAIYGQEVRKLLTTLKCQPHLFAAYLNFRMRREEPFSMQQLMLRIRSKIFQRTQQAVSFLKCVVHTQRKLLSEGRRIDDLKGRFNSLIWQNFQNPIDQKGFKQCLNVPTGTQSTCEEDLKSESKAWLRSASVFVDHAIPELNLYIARVKEHVAFQNQAYLDAWISAHIQAFRSKCMHMDQRSFDLLLFNKLIGRVHFSIANRYFPILLRNLEVLIQEDAKRGFYLSQIKQYLNTPGADISLAAQRLTDYYGDLDLEFKSESFAYCLSWLVGREPWEAFLVFFPSHVQQLNYAIDLLRANPTIQEKIQSIRILQMQYPNDPNLLYHIGIHLTKLNEILQQVKLDYKYYAIAVLIGMQTGLTYEFINTYIKLNTIDSEARLGSAQVSDFYNAIIRKMQLCTDPRYLSAQLLKETDDFHSRLTVKIGLGKNELILDYLQRNLAPHEFKSICHHFPSDIHPKANKGQFTTADTARANAVANLFSIKMAEMRQTEIALRGPTIQQLRIARGLSQSALANRLRNFFANGFPYQPCSQSTISRIERNLRKVADIYAVAICEVLEVDRALLLSQDFAHSHSQGLDEELKRVSAVTLVHA